MASIFCAVSWGMNCRRYLPNGRGRGGSGKPTSTVTKGGGVCVTRHWHRVGQLCAWELLALLGVGSVGILNHPEWTQCIPPPPHTHRPGRTLHGGCACHPQPSSANIAVPATKRFWLDNKNDGEQLDASPQLPSSPPPSPLGRATVPCQAPSQRRQPAHCQRQDLRPRLARATHTSSIPLAQEQLPQPLQLLA